MYLYYKANLTKKLRYGHLVAKRRKIFAKKMVKFIKKNYIYDVCIMLTGNQ